MFRYSVNRLNEPELHLHPKIHRHRRRLLQPRFPHQPELRPALTRLLLPGQDLPRQPRITELSALRVYPSVLDVPEPLGTVVCAIAAPSRLRSSVNVPKPGSNQSPVSPRALARPAKKRGGGSKKRSSTSPGKAACASSARIPWVSTTPPSDSPLNPLPPESPGTSALRSRIEAVLEVSAESEKPMAVILFTAGLLESEKVASVVHDHFVETEIPVFPTFGRAVHAVSRLISYPENQAI